MTRHVFLLLLAGASAILLTAADTPPAPAGGDVVFRSDVSMVRVDAQVLDRDNRAVTGLSAQDFVLLEQGRKLQIRGFSDEKMPVDVLLLLDVSGSMRPHIERIGSAAHQALRVLADNDRVGIMVFDRSTRVRLPFRSDRAAVEREFESLLRHEGFNGGTDITRAMIDAANYVGREGRRDARRAIVIVTDDETEVSRGRDEARVSRALASADAVLMALIAPDAMGTGRMGRGRQGGGSWPGGPGGGGGMGGPLGGIILGRRGPYGGRGPMGGPSGGPMGPRTESAGTAEIARQSGGDSMPVDDAYALETTLSRIRQRYALYFYLPDGVKAGQERNIEVELADASRRRYPDADVRFRRVYMAPGSGSGAAEPAVVSQVPASQGNPNSPPDPDRPRIKRRPAVNEDGTLASTPEPKSSTSAPAPSQPQPAVAPQPSGGWRRVDEPAPKAGPITPETSEKQPETGGWRKVKPGEQQ